MGNTTHLVKTAILKGSSSAVCEKCHMLFSADALTIHHVIPRKHSRELRRLSGDPLIMKPLNSYGLLCRNCHDEIEHIYKIYDAENIASFVNNSYYKLKSAGVALDKNQLAKYTFYTEICGLTHKKYQRSFITGYRKATKFYKTIYQYFLEDKLRAVRM